MVLTDQVRSIDSKARILRYVETAPLPFVLTVRAYVGRLLGLELAGD
jgi:mRNA interferase MazF